MFQEQLPVRIANKRSHHQVNHQDPLRNIHPDHFKRFKRQLGKCRLALHALAMLDPKLPHPPTATALQSLDGPLNCQTE